MRHVRMLGLCLVALFVLAAVGAGSAMAEGPEWGRCLHIEPAKGKEIKKGNYEDPNCTKVAVKITENKKTHVVTETPDHKGHYEWYTGTSPVCEKKAKAEFTYKDNKCSVVATKKGVPDHKGKYEWGPGPKFTGEGGAGVLKAAMVKCVNGKEIYGRKPRADCEDDVYRVFSTIPEEVKCSSETATGEAVGTDEVANVEVLFTGCNVSGTSLHTLGYGPGEVKVNKLKGHLGYINKTTTPREVGIVLEPAAGTTFATFRTETEELPLEFVVGVGSSTEGAFWTPEATGGNDGIISPITPVNAMTHTFTQEYRTVTLPYDFPEYKIKGIEIENVPSHFEGGPTELLETYFGSWNVETTYAWSSSGEEITNVNAVEGEAEIKA